LAIWVLRIETYDFVLIYSSFDELSRKILGGLYPNEERDMQEIMWRFKIIGIEF
jgi:hypothetical protein